MLLASPHSFINNLAHVINPWEFNPTAFSRPLAIWMFYFAICRNRQWRTVLTGVLLFAVSVKNAWMPSLLCCLAVAFRSRPAIRRCVFAVLLLAPPAILLGSRFLLRSDPTAASLWDLLTAREGSEANPFLLHSRADWAGVLQFVAVMLLSLCTAGGSRYYGDRAKADAGFDHCMAGLGSLSDVGPEVPAGSADRPLLAEPWLLASPIGRLRRIGHLDPQFAVENRRAMHCPFDFHLDAGAAGATEIRSGTVGLVDCLLGGLGRVSAQESCASGERGSSRIWSAQRRRHHSPVEFILLPTLTIFVLGMTAYSYYCNRDSLRALAANGVLGENRTALGPEWRNICTRTHPAMPSCCQ